MLGKGCVDLVSQAVGQGQAIAHAILILSVEVVLVSVRDNQAAAALAVARRQTEKEVDAGGAAYAGTVPAGCRERERAVVASVERIPHLEFAPLITKLEAMFALQPAKVVGNLVSLVLARLRAVGAKAQIEVASDPDEGISSPSGILRKNVRKTDGTRLHDLLREDRCAVKPCVAQTQFVQDVGVESVVPRSNELLGVGERLIDHARQRGASERYGVDSCRVLSKRVERQRVLLTKILIQAPEVLVGLASRDRLERVLVRPQVGKRHERFYESQRRRVEILSWNHSRTEEAITGYRWHDEWCCARGVELPIAGTGRAHDAGGDRTRRVGIPEHRQR